MSRPEALESRRLLAAVSWDGGGDGVNWSDAANWSTNALPTSNDDVTINVAANPTIIIAGGQSIKSLNTSEKLQINSGVQLSLMNASTISADMEINGALQINTGNLTVNATINLGKADGSTYGTIYMGNGLSAAHSILGSGSIALGGNANNTVYNYAPNTLTIGSSITIKGKSGLLYNAYAGGSIINQGTLSAEVAGGNFRVGNTNGSFSSSGTIRAINGATLSIESAAWANTGTINVNASILNLGGTFTSANLGTLNRTGGTVNLVGQLNGGIALNATTGSFTMAGGKLVGGTISESGGAALLFTTQGGTLDGVTVNGDLDLTQVNASSFTVLNTLTLNGTMSLGKADASSYAMVYFGNGQNNPRSLAGNATVVFGGNTNNTLYNYAPATLTFGSNVLIRGKSGHVYNSYAGGSIVNTGTIQADVAGGLIRFGSTSGSATSSGTLRALNGGTLSIEGAWSNTGLIHENASTLILAGSFTKAGLGNFTRTGGTVNLAGTLTGGLTLDSTLGSWNLAGGTLAGGTVSQSGGAQLIATTQGGTLDGVIVNGNLEVGQTNNAANFTVKNSLTLNGQLFIGKADGSSYGAVYFGNGTATPASLLGNAIVVFGKNSNNILYNYAPATLNLGPGVLIRGDSGYVYNSYANGVINNQGIISADVAGGIIRYGNSAGSTTSSGTLRSINGGTLLIEGAWAATGAISTNASTLGFRGSFNKSSLNNFSRNGGTVNLEGTITGGLNLNATTGNFNLMGGTIDGGTLNESAGAKLIMTPTGGVLDSVTVNGDLDVGQTNNAASFIVRDYLSINGTISLGKTDGSSYGSIYFGNGTANNTILGGAANVVFGGNASNTVYNYSPATFTISNGVTIHGKSGYVYNSYPGGTTVNNGLISSDVAGGTINISTSTGQFFNEGAIEAAPGTIAFSGAYNNSGGSMTVGIGGNVAGTSYGRFIVNGAFIQGGTLNSPRINNYSPGNGSKFDIITFTSTSGNFLANNLDSGNGISFTKSATATTLSLTAATGGASFATKSGETLTVNGTSGADTFSATANHNLYRIIRNGSTSVFRNSELTTININGGAGADTFNVRNGRIETINGGTESDTASIDPFDLYSNIEILLGGSISGTVFNDPNSNGVLDAGENGIGTWVVYLDTNNNNVKDANEAFRNTTASGSYIFEGLADGTYNVKQVPAPGYRKTLPGSGTPGYSVAVTSGSGQVNRNFGNTTNILLAGTVFNDANSNGVKDGGESGIAGVTINIVSNNITVATRITDANGFWQVKGLSSGTGEAQVVLPAGFTATNPANAKYAGSMTNGQQNANLNFGLHKTSPAPAFSSTSLHTILRSTDDNLLDEIVT